MKVVDSSIWLELLGRGPLVDLARVTLEDADQVLIPTMVMLEVHE